VGRIDCSEHISEQADLVRKGSASPTEYSFAIKHAVAELRERGDTLVHAEDLRLVAEVRRRHVLTADEQDQVDSAWERLEGALRDS
jgi:hypothetical protein